LSVKNPLQQKWGLDALPKRSARLDLADAIRYLNPRRRV